MKNLSFFSFIMAFVAMSFTGAVSAADNKDATTPQAQTEDAKALLKKKQLDNMEEAEDIIADDSSDIEKFSDSEEDDLSLEMSEAAS